MADDGVDDGSNFYNTPLDGSTPLPPSHIASLSETGQPSTLEKPRPQIPGLSLCNESDGHGLQSHPEQEQVTDASESMADSLDRVITAIEAAAKEEAGNISSGINGTGCDSGDTEMQGTKSDEDMVEKETENLASATNEARTLAELQTCDTTMLIAESAICNGATPVMTEALIAEDQPQENGEKEWETDSSPYESSSDSSSDSSTDSSDDDEDYEMLDPEEQARILLAAAGSDDEDARDESSAAREVRTANERQEDIVPKPNITVTPDMEVQMLGSVESIVENIVLIKANISGEYQVLEAGSVLCLANLEVIGVVSDTFGKVEQPLYTVHFTNSEEIKKASLEKGVPVFYVVDHSTFVFTQPLKGLKGSDASNLHDEEIGEDEVEFSDDEAEAEYKRQLKLKRQQKREGRSEFIRGGKSRGRPPGPSGLRYTELNYDDEPREDGYTTLQRPKDLHEQMMARNIPEERPYHHPDRSFRGGRGRGRGRGYDRGRRGHDRGGSARHQSYRNTHRQSPPSEQTLQNPSKEYPSDPTSYNPSPTAYPLPQSPPQAYPTMSPSAPQFPLPNFPFAPQQVPFPFPPPGSHINPTFFSNFMQQQQQQFRPQHEPSRSPATPTSQASTDAFTAAQAQLDLLRRLSGGGL
ncbi:hypothetical protein PRK78_000343 [Emydomyces testavorans]|uniref:H/ACA ribonucleoprotein complex non-core subunit NAF1 n=1 Tax=Emydomyces testavorans TaxID=2070801 RepID=A0AAF0DAI4_9EURO|nr:hypothetical protein PRK78_000343 [Emydomyces testavorans]